MWVALWFGNDRSLGSSSILANMAIAWVWSHTPSPNYSKQKAVKPHSFSSETFLFKIRNDQKHSLESQIWCVNREYYTNAHIFSCLNEFVAEKQAPIRRITKKTQVDIFSVATDDRLLLLHPFSYAWSLKTEHTPSKQPAMFISNYVL